MISPNPVTSRVVHRNDPQNGNSLMTYVSELDSLRFRRFILLFLPLFLFLYPIIPKNWTVITLKKMEFSSPNISHLSSGEPEIYSRLKRLNQFSFEAPSPSESYFERIITYLWHDLWHLNVSLQNVLLLSGDHWCVCARVTLVDSQNSCSILNHLKRGCIICFVNAMRQLVTRNKSCFGVMLWKKSCFYSIKFHTKVRFNIWTGLFSRILRFDIRGNHLKIQMSCVRSLRDRFEGKMEAGNS